MLVLQHCNALSIERNQIIRERREIFLFFAGLPSAFLKWFRTIAINRSAIDPRQSRGEKLGRLLTALGLPRISEDV